MLSREINSDFGMFNSLLEFTTFEKFHHIYASLLHRLVDGIINQVENTFHNADITS